MSRRTWAVRSNHSSRSVKKRVLQLIPSFHSGGSERQSTTLTRLLAEEGSYQIFAATLNKEGVLLSEFQNALHLKLPEFKLRSFYDSNFIRQVRRFAGYLKENEIDLIHTHDFYTNVFGMIAASMTGTPVKVASKRESEGLRSRGQDLLEKVAFGPSNAIVVNSKAVMDHLAGRGIPLAKMHLVYNGADVTAFNRTTDKFRLGLVPSDTRFITLVANLRHSVKNVPMFLRVAERVSLIRPDTHFVIAGEGNLEPELREMAAGLQVADRVHFIGRCDSIPELLNTSYACVLTSTAEGFSNSIIEYMAAGKPVVATDVGGATEAIQESITGFIVRSNDDAAMAEKLLVLLDDEDQARKMGTAGRSVASEKFSLESQLSSVLKLYERVTAN